MRFRFFVVFGYALLIRASPIGGHEVSLAINQMIDGGSNIFMSVADPIADGSYTLSPTIGAKGKLGGFANGEYRASYTPSYRVYFETEGADAFDNRADVVVSLDLARQDRLTANASYLAFESIQALAETNPDGSFDILVSNAGKVIRAFGGLGYSRSLSRRSAFSLQGDFEDYGYENSRNVGNKSLGLTASYTSVRSARLTLGGSVTARYRLFDDQQLVLGSFPVPIKVEGSRVTVANLNVLGSYTLSPTLKFDFKGGPSLIRTAPGKIPGIPSDAPNNDFTYFASLSLVRDFRESSLGLSYERGEDASGGLNRTAITEALTLRFSRRLGEDWDFSGAVGWSRRTAVDAFVVPDPSTGALVPISRESQLDRAWVLTKATRRLSKKLRISLTFRYQRWIEYSIADVKQPEQENVSGALQIRYSFEPYVY